MPPVVSQEGPPESSLISFVLVSIASLLPDGLAVRIGALVVSVLATTLCGPLLRVHLPESKSRSLSRALEDAENEMNTFIRDRLLPNAKVAPTTARLKLTLVELQLKASMLRAEEVYAASCPWIKYPSAFVKLCFALHHCLVEVHKLRATTVVNALTEKQRKLREDIIAKKAKWGVILDGVDCPERHSQ